MVLRSLSMFGFKSFADKLDVEFGPGITAIIGPNGCGKSNIIDAIRWVFGEQKASALRSSNMQDVIFSGSQKRQALSFAEVTLTIDNSKGILPIEYGQVAITRRIFRSGETEYRINKVPCRLRDIQNLFMDTGIGNSVYTTIENAMINQILSDKAEERRMLFDEAAGIGKYKQRRKESQRQLERTSQDLLRITDKVQEADRQVRMLARHVEKARRRKSYLDDLKKVEVSYEFAHYRRYAEALERRRRELAELESAREVLRGRIAAVESAVEKMQLEAIEKENLLQVASRNVGDAGERINSIDRDISVCIERQDGLNDKAARLVQEINTLAGQIDERSAIRMQIEKSLVERQTVRDQCSLRLAGAKDELDAFDARISQSRQENDQLVQRQIDGLREIGDLRNSLSNLEAQLNAALEKHEQYAREEQALQARIDEYTEAIESSKRQLEDVTEAHERLLQSREVLVSRIEKEDDRYHKLVELEKRCEARIDASKAQLKFLAGLDAAFEGYESGVKALLTARLPGVIGTVADCISVTDEKVIPIVERALGDAIQTVVFSSDEELSGGVAFLSKANSGAARMVSAQRLERVSAARSSLDLPGVTSATSFIAVNQGGQALADALLGSLYITDTAERAMEVALSVEGPYLFASLDGVIAGTDGTVIAGHTLQETAGILQRKQQIQKLTDDLAALEKEYQSHVHEKDICIINRDEARFALIEVDEKINRGKQAQQEQETTIKHYDTEIHTIAGRIDGLREEGAETQRRIAELERQVVDQEKVLADAQAQHAALERRIEDSRSALAAQEEERRALVEHHKNVELEMHGLNNRISQDRGDIERLGREIADLTRRRAATLEDQRQTAVMVEEVKARIVELQAQLEREKARRAELEQAMDAAREDYAGAQARIDELRRSTKTDQADFEATANKMHELELQQTRDEQEQRRIRERIWEAHEVDLEAPGIEIAALEGDEAQTVETISVLKERIKRVGEVNMAALEDFEIENARLAELTKQRDDLQNAVDDLEKAIKKLDKEARQQFVETFEKVRQNFTEMFTTLFEGGEANLVLRDDVDVLEAQIEINVRPAGKKMRSVQLLSGGERALTAISLLFSLYLVKPSAYCILDELDAPLDDANIGRFTRILRKFSEQTQFVVVTHNKRTMECADVLYGVTQQEKGISSIVSVKFEEAQLQAA